MPNSSKDILKDSKMLSIAMKEIYYDTTITYNEQEELKCYLTNLLNQAKSDQDNALLLQQKKQMRQNIQNQIQAMKRYIAK